MKVINIIAIFCSVISIVCILKFDVTSINFLKLSGIAAWIVVAIDALDFNLSK